MEHIHGFTQNHWMLPMGECLRSIAPEVAIVIEIGGKHIHNVHTPWVTPLTLVFMAMTRRGWRDSILRKILLMISAQNWVRAGSKKSRPVGFQQ
jgi:hypothetical protein